MSAKNWFCCFKITFFHSCRRCSSGFRAFSREAALKLNIFDNYTYTMETLIQAGAKGLRIKSVPCEINPKLKKIPDYSRIFLNTFFVQ